MSETVWVKDVCPDCVDANRQARRRCKAIGGRCGGKGWVWRTTSGPVAPAMTDEETEVAPEMWERLREVTP